AQLDGTGLAATRVADLVVRLHAAHHRGQRDARQWMRELVLGVLAHAPAGGDRAVEIDGLLRLVADYFDPDEMAAFALAPRSRLLALRSEGAIHLQQRAREARRGLAQDVDKVDKVEQVEAAEGGPAPRWAERLRRLAPGLPETSPRAAAPVEAPGLESPARASLWPTTQVPCVHAATGGNRLRLISAQQRLSILDDARLLVVCVVRNERVMLPHFLAHHRRLGARAFVVVDNQSDDATRAYLSEQPDVVLYAADTDYRDSHFGVAWQQAVLATHACGRWALLADADEFLLADDAGPDTLPKLLDALEAGGHDAARLLMVDLYPRESLRTVDFATLDPATAAGWMDSQPFVRWHLGGGLYTNGPTWLSALRHRLIPNSPPNAYTAQKTALLRWRPGVRLSEGLHYASGLHPAPRPLRFGHYKYHAGLRAKVILEVERKQHFDGASEYAHYLHMVAEPDATLFDAARSVPLAAGAAPGAGESAA
ncbi:MAG TPA: glycosyltransferase family 2 protein, partial [Burkholderiaceae bacterium]|nr:glycosyltransferase family 2 protein [Burkholderiaceae bacterium]